MLANPGSTFEIRKRELISDKSNTWVATSVPEPLKYECDKEKNVGINENYIEGNAFFIIST